ncbi:MAG: TetR/AcrR family transcriptional regulator; helix-turn-helix transcriptional regulator [Desmonostoc vinosum HA7617-LM4]|nr:TetR/AcrR family transcriptional regulator; helix-turn-helix transcriptional regulator [Desmonostoc vinosum HA7617-LM4]
MSDFTDGSDQPQKSPQHKEVDKSGTILAGAMQEFIKSGYTAASMDRIAVAAGVSKPTLYSYFRDKAGLFAALIQKMTLGSHNSRLFENEQLLQLPLRDVLKQIATASLEKMSGKQPLFTLIRLIIGESGRFPALAQTFVRNGEKPMLEELSYLFANHPDLKAGDPEVLARCFHGSIVHYIILQEILHGRDIVPLERDRFINGLIDLIVGERSFDPDQELQ